MWADVVPECLVRREGMAAPGPCSQEFDFMRGHDRGGGCFLCVARCEAIGSHPAMFLAPIYQLHCTRCNATLCYAVPCSAGALVHAAVWQSRGSAALLLQLCCLTLAAQLRSGSRKVLMGQSKHFLAALAVAICPMLRYSTAAILPSYCTHAHSSARLNEPIAVAQSPHP